MDFLRIFKALVLNLAVCFWCYNCPFQQQVGSPVLEQAELQKTWGKIKFERMLMSIHTQSKYLDMYVKDLAACKVESKDCKAIFI